MTDRTNIEKRVANVIREVVGNKDMAIKSTDSLVEDLGLDSVDFASLVMSLEDEFGGTVEDERSAQLVSVNDIVDHILEREVETA